MHQCPHWHAPMPALRCREKTGKFWRLSEVSHSRAPAYPLLVVHGHGIYVFFLGCSLSTCCMASRFFGKPDRRKMEETWFLNQWMRPNYSNQWARFILQSHDFSMNWLTLFLNLARASWETQVLLQSRPVRNRGFKSQAHQSWRRRRLTMTKPWELTTAKKNAWAKRLRMAWKVSACSFWKMLWQMQNSVKTEHGRCWKWRWRKHHSPRQVKLQRSVCCFNFDRLCRFLFATCSHFWIERHGVVNVLASSAH